MLVTVSLEPKSNARGMDSDEMFDRLFDAITHGALQRLLSMPRMPWTNRSAAEYYAEQYRFKKSKVRIDSEAGPGPVSVQATGMIAWV